MIDFDKAFEWWLKQGTNRKLDVVKTAKVDFGESTFADIFWELGEECGRDRIFPKGKGFKVVEL
jgi:hypothetical protein